MRGHRRHLPVQHGSVQAKVALPSLLSNQRCWIWTCFAPSLPTGFTNSHIYPSLPHIFLSYCHLHLHSGAFQGWEAFISAARQDADMERAALLQRTMYLSERMQARGHIWDLHNQKVFFPDPTWDLRPENSQGINRRHPSLVAKPLFEGE